MCICIYIGFCHMAYHSTVMYQEVDVKPTLAYASKWICMIHAEPSIWTRRRSIGELIALCSMPSMHIVFQYHQSKFSACQHDSHTWQSVFMLLLLLSNLHLHEISGATGSWCKATCDVAAKSHLCICSTIVRNCFSKHWMCVSCSRGVALSLHSHPVRPIATTANTSWQAPTSWDTETTL